MVNGNTYADLKRPQIGIAPECIGAWMREGTCKRKTEERIVSEWNFSL